MLLMMPLPTLADLMRVSNSAGTLDWYRSQAFYPTIPQQMFFEMTH